MVDDDDIDVISAQRVVMINRALYYCAPCSVAAASQLCDAADEADQIVVMATRCRNVQQSRDHMAVCYWLLTVITVTRALLISLLHFHGFNKQQFTYCYF